jgi:hypothetical protein
MIGGSRRRFQWRNLTLCWVLIVMGLVIMFRQSIIEGTYLDVDDEMRMMQVRDLLGGQSWFDLTQYRINAPEGLAMHWSRLVDIPIMTLIVIFKPLFGVEWAERIAAVGAPALALFTLLAAMLATIRRLFGPTHEFGLVAALLPISAPIVIFQFYPTRIDHHGWQMASAAAAIAFLLAGAPRLSGLGAGLALGVYLSISVEGVPFVAAVTGAAGLLWAFGIDRSARFKILMVSLAATATAAFMLATTGDWNTLYCDAVAPGHLAALSAAAAGVALGDRFAPNTRLASFAVLGFSALAAAASLAMVAPQCLGSPFGTMDPLVHKFWYLGVYEGLPAWRQDVPAAVGMIVFPLVGTIGAAFVAARAQGVASRRRWLTIAIISIVAMITGILVRRAAGVAHVVALPGAFAVMLWLREWLGARVRSSLQPVVGALTMLLMAPFTPVFAAAMAVNIVDAEPLTSEASEQNLAAKPMQECTWSCAMEKLAVMPRMAILTGIDIGPRVIMRTHHTVYAASYHRLQKPMRASIDIFTASPAKARSLLAATGFRYILIAPTSSEADLFGDIASDGLIAHLVANKIPAWLEPIDLGSKQMKLYRVRD